MHYKKVKSASKSILTKGPDLSDLVADTMKTISSLVGSTLGPGGYSVLIERQEIGLPPIVSKDGVTCFKALGFKDANAQLVLESVRDAANKTADSAGDGTTTATILAEAFVRYTRTYLEYNPKLSPQKVLREVNSILKNYIDPILQSLVINPGPFDGEFLKAVARVSANGDVELAEGVMKAFDISGDEGNITLSEISGDSGVKIEEIKGYPFPIGYEESAKKFHPAFINDTAHQRIYLENCLFVLYFGNLTEVQTLLPAMEVIHKAWQGASQESPHNIILVATGFSEDVLGTLAVTFPRLDTLKIVPVIAPVNAILNSQLHFLQDLSAFTTSAIFDPLNKPLHTFKISDAGRPMQSFEMNRYRSILVGDPDEMLVLDRIEQLKAQMKDAESKLETSVLNERIAKLSGGIVKMQVSGNSSGEIRERRDRAEDAICAVRGALKHGCLPGGGYGLLRICSELLKLDNPIALEIVSNALMTPVQRLLTNAGLNEEEVGNSLTKMYDAIKVNEVLIYDAEDQNFVNPLVGPKIILDSFPAVSEAIHNSISSATLLGTLGGIIAFERDDQVDREESSDTYNYLRNAGNLK